MKRILVALALVLAGTGAAAPAGFLAHDAQNPKLMQFRDLFRNGGKPSVEAAKLSGQSITLTGFLTPAPTMESPFLVMVGAPTAHCPYCESVNEQDHLPYVLVYPDEAFDRAGIGARTRIRVTGKLSAAHAYEGFYGLHNDIRILSATVERDGRALNPATQRQKRAAPVRPAVAPQIDED